jgi:hypothetical protein
MTVGVDRGLVGRSPAGRGVTRQSLVTRWKGSPIQHRRAGCPSHRRTDCFVAGLLAMAVRRQALLHSRLNCCANFDIVRLRRPFCKDVLPGPLGKHCLHVPEFSFLRRENENSGKCKSFLEGVWGNLLCKEGSPKSHYSTKFRGTGMKVSTNSTMAAQPRSRPLRSRGV